MLASRCLGLDALGSVLLPETSMVSEEQQVDRGRQTQSGTVMVYFSSTVPCTGRCNSSRSGDFMQPYSIHIDVDVEAELSMQLSKHSRLMHTVCSACRCSPCRPECGNVQKYEYPSFLATRAWQSSTILLLGQHHHSGAQAKPCLHF